MKAIIGGEQGLPAEVIAGRWGLWIVAAVGGFVFSGPMPLVSTLGLVGLLAGLATIWSP